MTSASPATWGLDRQLTIPPFKNVAYYEISQHRVQWWDSVNTAITLQIPQNVMNFLSNREKISSIKRALLHGAGDMNENKLSQSISGQLADRWPCWYKDASQKL